LEIWSEEDLIKGDIVSKTTSVTHSGYLASILDFDLDAISAGYLK